MTALSGKSAHCGSYLDFLTITEYFDGSTLDKYYVTFRFCAKHLQIMENSEPVWSITPAFIYHEATGMYFML